jgi:hypothetical protein
MALPGLSSGDIKEHLEEMRGMALKEVLWIACTSLDKPDILHSARSIRTHKFLQSASYQFKYWEAHQ